MTVGKANASDSINIRVVNGDSVLRYKMRKHSTLKNLMNHYCERNGLSMATTRFSFDGQAISETDTPSSLEMEEGDAIELEH